jgi:hypothetical protein
MFSGKLSGIKNESYYWNKIQQGRDYNFLKSVADKKGIELTIIDPTKHKISVNRWDKDYLYPTLKILGISERQFVDIGDSEEQRKVFLDSLIE